MNKKIYILIFLVSILFLTGCTGTATPTSAPTKNAPQEPTKEPTQEPTEVPPTPTAVPTEPEPLGPLTLTSTSFENEGQIPSVYALPPFQGDKFMCDGAPADKENRSPALAWENVPYETKSLLIVMVDQLSYAWDDLPDDALFTHWIVYNLPPDVTSLPEALPGELELPAQAAQGKNGYPEPYKVGYGGPCPPASIGGEHLYIIKLYALDTMLDESSGSYYETLKTAIEGHILAEAELKGYFTNQ